MAVLTVSQQINAGPEVVFAACSDFARLPERVPAIKKVEMLTPGPVGVGTKFRETRIMFGREATEGMEFVAFDPPRQFELRAISCGAEYRTIHRFTPAGSGTRIDLEFRVKALSLL